MSSSQERKVLVRDLNTLLTCTLCNGYFIDAMTFDACLHSFCRSCILNHFDTTKQQACPKCDKKKATFKPDHQLQALVYKLVPGLFGKETQRREDFTRSSLRASSTCSEDSVLGDVQKDQEKWISQSIGTSGTDNFLSPEDPISLSLEFYQAHLDITDCRESNRKLSALCKRSSTKAEVNTNVDQCASANNSSETVGAVDKVDKVSGGVEEKDKSVKDEKDQCKLRADRRYLQCPAAVSMSHLQKFLRMKYALSAEHRVDIIYEGEVLPLTYSLMDVAYTYNWTKVKPMRFFYRIFTPLKVQPIKIINTPTGNGGKHLQIVPVRSTSGPIPAVPLPPATASSQPSEQQLVEAEKSKEQFVAQLKLQSTQKHKVHVAQAQTISQANKMPKDKTHKTIPAGSSAVRCHVFEYEEPDEEIKRFAESRDREWARMRHDDGDGEADGHMDTKILPIVDAAPAGKGKELDDGSSSTTHHTKKRKKNKHSRGDAKKPKIHAEITSDVQVQQESIKLKVKLTPAHQHNGHKHKHKSVAPSVTTTPTIPATLTPAPVVSVSVPALVTPPSTTISPISTPLPRVKEPVRKLHDICIKKGDRGYQNSIPQASESERRREEQKTFLKAFSSNASSRPTVQKVPTTANSKPVQPEQKKPMITYSNHTKQNFEKKIAALKLQAMKLEQKKQETINGTNNNQSSPKDKKVTFSLEKPHILNSQQYPSGFTVSKVEQGQGNKRRQDVDAQVDKRPCLEITLIPSQQPKPPPSPAPHRGTDTGSKVRRPPPATIPLDRIKKSSMKVKESGCPTAIALDLTKKTETPKNGITTLNGMKFPAAVTSIASTLTENLHMLSKVALQHQKQQAVNAQSPKQNGSAGSKKLQIPNLQTLRIPSITSSSSTNSASPTTSASSTSTAVSKSSPPATKTSPVFVTPQRTVPNLVTLPKLNEINKRLLLSNHNNNLKSIQRSSISSNQNMIRSIPNPAMLVRQHNQSRLTLNGQQTQSSASEKEKPQNGQPKILNPLAKENTTGGAASGSKESLMNKMLDQHKGQMMVSASNAAAVN